MWSRGLLTLASAALTLASDVQDCSCGFLDSESGELYTDATILYFNETADLTQDFYAQHFANKKQYGWTSVYRAGALTDNVNVGNSTTAVSNSNWDSESLSLFIDPATNQHLINGGSIESLRRDIRYGSFRAFMRGPQAGTGGSAMSMIMQQNESSSIEIDMLNTKDRDTARITTLANGEYPGGDVSVNYTTLAMGNASLSPIDPWQFVEVRLDWTMRNINYTIGRNMSRSIRKKSSIPTEPLPLAFRHWSTGDIDFMEGPPYQRAEANVAWIRAFFNSSLDTKTIRNEFDARCVATSKCSVDDTSLRGSTSYSPAALVPWKEPKPKQKWMVPVAASAGAATAIGLICLINVIFRTKPWKTMFNGERRYEPAELDLGAGLTSPYTERMTAPSDVKTSDIKTDQIPPGSPLEPDDPKYQGFPVPEEDDVLAELDSDKGLRRRSVFKNQNQRHGSIPSPGPGGETHHEKRPSVSFGQQTIFQRDFSFGGAPPQESRKSDAEIINHDFAFNAPTTPRARQMSLFAQSRAFSTSTALSDSNSMPQMRRRQSSIFQSVAMSVVRLASIGPEVTEIPDENHTNEHLGEANNIDNKEWNTQARNEIPTVDPPFNALNADRRPTLAEAIPVASVDLPLAKAKSGEKRVNYLAGLVSFACLGVTAIHFCLTFVPVAGGLNGDTHYRSEYWARWTVEPFILNPMWLGPLFVTSCRFLVGGFFMKGDLKDIAQKMLLRAPRMIIPIIITALLEYFFLELGLMEWLLWLPSISWSTWPYIINYSNWGVFLNDMIEMAYLIPNAAPQIVSHYCVGILWTVPVQLQFSYTALLAAVVIRDIKTPYKRFLVYAIAITTNWYALSWGACFWGGVLLADLQVTFKLSKWLQANPKIWYPTAIILWCVAIACPVMALLEDRLGYLALTDEHNIHPDATTGLPLGRTARAGYPLYFEPRLNTLLFACSLQFLLETSKWFQAFFSLRFWQPVFPHAYTIYLIHGFVFWSLGSFMAVKLSLAGLPYWANLLVTALCCYTCLALVTLALSPLTEMANAAACKNILRWSTAPPVPERRTLSPFPPDLFLGRSKSSDDDQNTDEERGMVTTADQGAPKELDQVNEKNAVGTEKQRRGTVLTINEVESSGSSASGSKTGRSSSSSSH